MELREALPKRQEERIWRDALAALVAGLAVPARPKQRQSAKQK
jgi:hypothetical protein